MKIVLTRHPHARKRRKVVPLLDIVERFSHQVRIEHRTFHILHTRWSTGRRTNIENAHATTPREKGYQVLSDKAAAARNERLRHGCWPASGRGSPGWSGDP